MDDFTILTDKDKLDMSYGACVGGFIVTGAAFGRLALLPGLLTGAAVGLTVGLIACRRLSPAIERKLFSHNDQLSDQELLQALRLIRDETGVNTKSDAMFLLSQVRMESSQKGQSLFNNKTACMPMRIAANHLLSARPNRGLYS